MRRTKASRKRPSSGLWGTHHAPSLIPVMEHRDCLNTALAFATAGTGYRIWTDTRGQSDKGFRSPRINGGAISIRQCPVRLEEATDTFRSVVHVLGRFAHMIPTSRITETRPINVSHDCRRNGSGQRDRDMFGSYGIHQLHIQGRAVSIDVAVPVEIKAMIVFFFWRAFIYQVYVRRIPNV